MNLKQFIRQKRGRSAELARALSISRSYLSQLASGTTAMPVKTAVLIEGWSSGQVSRKEMFPDDWHHIWPELLVEHRASSDRSPSIEGFLQVEDAI